MTGWDNTARRGTASHIFHDATPEHYEVWLGACSTTRAGTTRATTARSSSTPGTSGREGAYLEPDETHGYGYLEATARAVFGAPDRSALFATLRQITDGNDEAQRLLDELEHVVKVNERTAALIEAGDMAAQRPTRDGVSATFHAIESAGFTVPSTIVSDAAVGFVDSLNTPNYQRGVTLNRNYDVLLQGWIASRHVTADANSPVILQLTNLETGNRYVTRVLARMRRDDVVAHLAGQRAYRRLGADCALFSGYRAYLNIAALDPGAYTLDAILPLAGEQRGVTLRLHSSIVVL